MRNQKQAFRKGKRPKQSTRFRSSACSADLPKRFTVPKAQEIEAEKRLQALRAQWVKAGNQKLIA